MRFINTHEKGKKILAVVLSLVMVASLLTGIGVIWRSQRAETAIADQSAGYTITSDGKFTFPSTYDQTQPIGSKNNPYIVLEIVPNENMAQMGYLVGGKEPIDVMKAITDSDSAKKATNKALLGDYFGSMTLTGTIAKTCFDDEVTTDELDEYTWKEGTSIDRYGELVKNESNTGDYNLKYETIKEPVLNLEKTTYAYKLESEVTAEDVVLTKEATLEGVSKTLISIPSELAGKIALTDNGDDTWSGTLQTTMYAKVADGIGEYSSQYYKYVDKALTKDGGEYSFVHKRVEDGTGDWDLKAYQGYYLKLKKTGKYLGILAPGQTSKYGHAGDLVQLSTKKESAQQFAFVPVGTGGWYNIYTSNSGYTKVLQAPGADNEIVVETGSVNTSDKLQQFKLMKYTPAGKGTSERIENGGPDIAGDQYLYINGTSSSNQSAVSLYYNDESDNNPMGRWYIEDSNRDYRLFSTEKGNLSLIWTNVGANKGNYTLVSDSEAFPQEVGTYVGDSTIKLGEYTLEKVKSGDSGAIKVDTSVYARKIDNPSNHSNGDYGTHDYAKYVLVSQPVYDDVIKGYKYFLETAIAGNYDWEPMSYTECKKVKDEDKASYTAITAYTSMEKEILKSDEMPAKIEKLYKPSQRVRVAYEGALTSNEWFKKYVIGKGYKNSHPWEGEDYSEFVPQAGWYYEPECVNAFDVNDAILSDITLYKKWKSKYASGNFEETYKVTFDANAPTEKVANAPDGDIKVFNMPESINDVAKGSVLVQPKLIPVCDGYVFLGWYTAATGGTQFKFRTSESAGTKVNANITLYAKWQKLDDTAYATVATSEGTVDYKYNTKYTIKFDMNLGHGLNASEILNDASKKAYLAPEFDAEGNPQIVAGEIVYTNTTIDVTDLNKNGYKDSAFSYHDEFVSKNAYRDEAESVKRVNPVRTDGIIFGGWYQDESCTIPFEFDQPIGDIKYTEIKLYARWIDPTTKYSVTFDANKPDQAKGEVTMPSALKKGITVQAKDGKLDNKDYDKLNQTLVLQGNIATAIANYNVEVITVTPKDLAKEDNLVLIDRASMIVLNETCEEAYSDLWKEYKNTALFQKSEYKGTAKSFKDNDLTWAAVLRIFSRITGIKADGKSIATCPVIYDYNIYKHILAGETNKITVTGKLSTGENATTNTVKGSAKNIYKLYLMTQVMNPLTFNNAFLGKENLIDNSGKYTVLGADKWNAYTFIPYSIITKREWDQDESTYKTGVLSQYAIDLDVAQADKTSDLNNRLFIYNSYDASSDTAKKQTSNVVKALANSKNFNILTYVGQNDVNAFMLNKSLSSLTNTDSGSYSVGDMLYYMNYAPQANTNFDEELNILEVEPSNNHKPTDTKNVNNFWFWYISRYVPNFTGKFTVKQMSSSEFIGSVEDLNSLYDAIYIGVDVPEDKAFYTDFMPNTMKKVTAKKGEKVYINYQQNIDQKYKKIIPCTPYEEGTSSGISATAKAGYTRVELTNVVGVDAVTGKLVLQNLGDLPTWLTSALQTNFVYKDTTETLVNGATSSWTFNPGDVAKGDITEGTITEQTPISKGTPTEGTITEGKTDTKNNKQTKNLSQVGTRTDTQNGTKVQTQNGTVNVTRSTPQSAETMCYYAGGAAVGMFDEIKIKELDINGTKLVLKLNWVVDSADQATIPPDSNVLYKKKTSQTKIEEGTSKLQRTRTLEGIRTRNVDVKRTGSQTRTFHIIGGWGSWSSITWKDWTDTETGTWTKWSSWNYPDWGDWTIKGDVKNITTGDPSAKTVKYDYGHYNLDVFYYSDGESHLVTFKEKEYAKNTTVYPGDIIIPLERDLTYTTGGYFAYSHVGKDATISGNDNVTGSLAGWKTKGTNKQISDAGVEYTKRYTVAEDNTKDDKILKAVYSGNDITKKKYDELVTFIKAGYPVILSDRVFVFNDAFNGTKKADSSRIDEEKIDKASNMYEFLCDLVDDYPSACFIDSYTENDDKFITALQKKTFRLKVSSQPKEYKDRTLDAYSSLKDSDVYINVKDDQTLDSKSVMRYEFEIDSTKIGGNYELRFYIDTDADGRFSSDEQMSIEVKTAGSSSLTRSASKLNGNTKYVATRQIDEYVGVIPWKLEVLDKDSYDSTMKDYLIKDEVTGYCAIKVKEKQKLHILQITPNKGIGSTDRRTGTNAVFPTASEIRAAYDNKGEDIKKSNALTYFNGVKLKVNGTEYQYSNEAARKDVFESAGMFYYYTHILDEFQVEFFRMSVSEFTKVVTDSSAGYLEDGECTYFDTVKGHKYDANGIITNNVDDSEDAHTGIDMIILGYADIFTDITNQSALEYIENFISAGNTALFTHDTTSFFGKYPGDGKGGSNNLDYWGFFINQYFRGFLGMDRYDVLFNFGRAQDSSALHPELISLGASKYADAPWYYEGGEKKYKTATSNIDTYVNGVTKSGEKTRMLNQGFTNALINGDATDGGHRTNKVTKANDGQIINYPYAIDDTFQVADTHSQYYQLNMEMDDVVVWYCLTNSGDAKDLTHYQTKNDVRNNYYIYNKGNVTYSGVGHNSNLTDMERRLFVNTMIAAYRATPDATDPVIKNLDKSTSGKTDYLYVDYDASYASDNLNALPFGDEIIVYNKAGKVIDEEYGKLYQKLTDGSFKQITITEANSVDDDGNPKFAEVYCKEAETYKKLAPDDYKASYFAKRVIYSPEENSIVINKSMSAQYYPVIYDASGKRIVLYDYQLPLETYWYSENDSKWYNVNSDEYAAFLEISKSNVYEYYTRNIKSSTQKSTWPFEVALGYNGLSDDKKTLQKKVYGPKLKAGEKYYVDVPISDNYYIVDGDTIFNSASYKATNYYDSARRKDDYTKDNLKQFALDSNNKFEIQLEVVMQYGKKPEINPLKIGYRSVVIMRRGMFTLD